jgi:HPt (histidine-containing phosphotransfer) domain-containing protein
MAGLAIDQVSDPAINGDARHRAIDLAFLARQTMGNKNLENEILQLFRMQLRKFEPDWAKAQLLPNVEITIHSMRSAALGVGAGAIAELSRTAELEIRENGGKIGEIYAQLAKAVRVALDYIDQILGE